MLVIYDAFSSVSCKQIEMLNPHIEKIKIKKESSSTFELSNLSKIFDPTINCRIAASQAGSYIVKCSDRHLSSVSCLLTIVGGHLKIPLSFSEKWVSYCLHRA